MLGLRHAARMFRASLDRIPLRRAGITPTPPEAHLARNKYRTELGLRPAHVSISKSWGVRVRKGLRNAQDSRSLVRLLPAEATPESTSAVLGRSQVQITREAAPHIELMRSR